MSRTVLSADFAQDAPEPSFGEACDLAPDDIADPDFSDPEFSRPSLRRSPALSTRRDATQRDATQPDLTRHKGRGALSNRSGRFEATSTEAVDDGWRVPAPADPGPDPVDDTRPRTSVAIDASRTVIARNQSPDVPFDRSINPYRGCEHGCIYCFARPTHAYLGLSPGLDFETKLLAKPDAAAILRRELARPSYKVDTIALGTNTDPYQPVERERRITRQILEVLSETGHPVMIVTKSDLVTRDLDILGPMAARGLAKVGLSVTTLDRDLARSLEPRTPRPDKRLAAIRACREAGVPAGVLVAPIIPAVNDPEIEAILEAARDHGAGSASWVLLRLPLEIEDLMTEWLRTHVPDRADRVLSLVRQSRGGRLYRSDWGKRMSGEGPYAQMIAQRFRLACDRLGLTRRTADLDLSQFRPPVSPGAGPKRGAGRAAAPAQTQLDLF